MTILQAKRYPRVYSNKLKGSLHKEVKWHSSTQVSIGPWELHDMTWLDIQLSFCGPSYSSSRMLEKLRMETLIHIQLPTSHCYIVRAHVI